MRIATLAAILSIFASTAMQPTPVLAQAAPQTILFVCEHGAVKSVVAAAQFNKLAAERGLPFRAISRGTAPDPAVPPAVMAGLQKEGLAVPAGFAPSLVTATDVSAAARVVVFDVTLSPTTNASRLTRWDKLPAFSDGYGPASAAMVDKVKSLIEELHASTKKQ